MWLRHNCVSSPHGDIALSRPIRPLGRLWCLERVLNAERLGGSPLPCWRFGELEQATHGPSCTTGWGGHWAARRVSSQWDFVDSREIPGATSWARNVGSEENRQRGAIRNDMWHCNISLNCSDMQVRFWAKHIVSWLWSHATINKYKGGTCITLFGVISLALPRK